MERKSPQSTYRAHRGRRHESCVVAGRELGKGVRLICGCLPELHLTPEVAIQVLAVPANTRIALESAECKLREKGRIVSPVASARS